MLLKQSLYMGGGLTIAVASICAIVWIGSDGFSPESQVLLATVPLACLIASGIPTWKWMKVVRRSPVTKRHQIEDEFLVEIVETHSPTTQVVETSRVPLDARTVAFADGRSIMLQSSASERPNIIGLGKDMFCDETSGQKLKLVLSERGVVFVDSIAGFMLGRSSKARKPLGRP
jgi:hypothetical protein